MNPVIITLIALAAAVLVAYVLHELVTVVKDDGYRSRPSARAPRSHHVDPFDPRSRLA